MCRMIYVKSEEFFNIKQYLIPFADMCKKNKVFQGHGWGFSVVVKGEWKHYRNISPIWEDKDYSDLKTNRLIAHARSAFDDKDIIVENNMPFYDDNYVFAFNGELRNVKIKSEGRIGAEKIFNFIKRFDKGDISEALKKGASIIKKRTEHLRGMNIIITDIDNAFVYSTFSEDEDYFTMRFSVDKNKIIICSEQLNIKSKWKKLITNKVQVF